MVAIRSCLEERQRVEVANTLESPMQDELQETANEDMDIDADHPFATLIVGSHQQQHDFVANDHDTLVGKRGTVGYRGQAFALT